MANITVPRDPQRRAPESELSDLVEANTNLIKGAMYGLNAAGYAVNMESGVPATARGEVMYTVDNTGGAQGALRVRGRSGMFTLHPETGDEPTAVGAMTYFVDNQTVAATSDNGARPEAGYLHGLSAAGDPIVVVGPLGAGVGGAKTTVLSLGAVSAKAADGAVAYAVAPVAGVIKKFYSVLNAVLATADAEFQLQAGATFGALADVGSTTTGLITATSVGAVGDVDVATPVTTNTEVAVGDLIAAQVEGGSTATGTANLFVVIEHY
jgi:hypothetical protein